MIQYRSFCNPDPPRLAEVWTASLTGPRTIAIPARATTLLEHFLLSKPYFDPQGLLFAFDDERPVGFVLAGFAVNAGRSALDHSRGVLCALGVVPSHRRRGVGSELLRRAEEYLRGRGAGEILAGPLPPNNPFTFGLYGGANSPGVLDSYPQARLFFESRGYQLAASCGVWQRRLERVQVVPDLRFAALRQQYDIIYCPPARPTWWRECVLGPIEPIDFQVHDKRSHEVVASAALWEMDLFRATWQEIGVGLLHLEVEPTLRRRGLAKYLLSQLLMHLHRQSFSICEAQVETDNVAAAAMLGSLGFQQVDTGRQFRRVS